MERILYADQRGFCRNRSIQTATVPVLEAIHDTEKLGRPLQLLSVDLKAAFDTIAPQVIYKVMSIEKFPPVFVEVMKNLMATVKARVHINNMVGPERDVVCGNGQGNPPSTSMFNIGSDPVLRAVNNMHSCGCELTNGEKLPTIGLADDHLHRLRITYGQQVIGILEIYRKFQEVCGLTVSLSKTSIFEVLTRTQG